MSFQHADSPRLDIQTLRRGLRTRLLAGLLLGALVLSGIGSAACGVDSSNAGSTGPSRDEARLTVVASMSLIGEFAAQVAGAEVEVITIVPPGVEIHSFEPRTGVARDIVAADLLLANGLDLEGNLLDVMSENRGDGVPLIELASDAVEGDPHVWLDVARVISMVEQIADGLAEVDPDRAEGYRSRASDYIDTLHQLDAEVRDELAAVPESDRKLVVFHDSFGYFGRAYGFEVIASVQSANASQSASAADIVEVIVAVQESGVAAIYREPQFGADMLDVVADETNVRVMSLYSTPAEEIETYAAMMRANARAVATGLTNRPESEVSR